jgi:hypothetical protein
MPGIVKDFFHFFLSMVVFRALRAVRRFSTARKCCFRTAGHCAAFMRPVGVLCVLIEDEATHNFFYVKAFTLPLPSAGRVA